MDRPILLTNLFNVATPELGVKVAEAGGDPADLTRRVQALIDAAAVGGSSSPFLHGFELAGGGAGDSARVILTLGRNLGWGLNTSVPCGLARVLFRKAHHEAEIMTVLAQMAAAITAAAVNSPFVWQPRIVGTGRDGSYLIGMLWCDGNIASLALNVESFPVSGPYAVATLILGVTVPQTVDATVDTDQAWRVSWGMLVEDTTAAGFAVRLDLNTVPIWQAIFAGGPGTWFPTFGRLQHIQSATGNSLFELYIVPVGPVNLAGCSLRAEIANYPNNPS